MLVQCQNCQKRWTWTPRKGDRLADVICRNCGGLLKRVKRTEEEKRARLGAFGAMFRSFCNGFEKQGE